MYYAPEQRDYELSTGENFKTTDNKQLCNMYGRISINALEIRECRFGRVRHSNIIARVQHYKDMS